MLDNDWGITTYPFVPGHEIVGVVEEASVYCHVLLVATLCISHRSKKLHWDSVGCVALSAHTAL